MERSFLQWRDSSRQLGNASFVISDSEEEDSIKEFDKDALVIDESNDEDSDVSKHVKPRRSIFRHRLSN